MSAINREDAIKALEEVIGAMHPYRIPGVIETYSQYNEAWTDAIDKAVQAIEALPDADTGWVAVEDGPPEENGEYLVTRESGFYRYIDIVRKSNCNSDLPMASDIKAWMPLPKPYEPKEDK